MSNEILKELSQAMSKIDRPGTFCVSGSVQTVLPGLEVDGLGPIGLPLTGNQAKDLKTLCEQAPYGKGEKTLVDTSVRRVWRLSPSQFSLRNPDWMRLLEETLRKIQAELGLEKQKLESHGKIAVTTSKRRFGNTSATWISRPNESNLLTPWSAPRTRRRTRKS